MIVTIPNSWGTLQEFNPCHNPPGAGGGRFCSTPGSTTDPSRLPVRRATPDEFKAAVQRNFKAGTLSDYSLSDLAKMQLFMVEGHEAGYAIKDGDELVNLFNNSGVKGLGQWLAVHAIERGVRRGDHFDGMLTGFYQKLGFVEERREANWTPGGPDVVYIRWKGGDPATARERLRRDGRLVPGGV